jgi:eukaryotic-like serine/threonine-protein kinase
MAAVAADRDLLVGLLAPQDGQIDRGQLVAAFRAWTRDRDRPLAERLAGRGDLDPDGRAAVVVPASRHLKEHGGDPGRGLAAIPFGPSTRESLAAPGDAEIEQTFVRVGPSSGTPSTFDGRDDSRVRR